MKHATRLTFALMLLIAMSALTPVAAQEATPATDCPTATPEENLVVVRRFFEEGINAADLSVFDEVLSPDVIYHSATVADDSGPEGVKNIYSAALVGFPGIQYHFLASATGPDAVAVRYQAEGVHSGEFRGLAPTGKTITWTQSTFAHVACGQITEIWAEVSQLDRLRQLGVLATEGPAARMAGVGAPEATAVATPPSSESCATPSPEDALAVVDRVRSEVYNDGNFAVMPEIFSEDYVHGSANGPDAIGIEAGAQRIGTFVTAFPDLEWTFDEVVVDGNHVSARWTTRGMHNGELAGFAPTGKPVAFNGISLFTVQCGKVVEFQTEMDAAGMLEQVGAVVENRE